MKTLFILLFLVLIVSPDQTWGEYYQYTDKNGNLHFTDDIGNVPEEHRKSVLKNKAKQNLSPSHQKIQSAGTESDMSVGDNCGGELDDTIKGCKQTFQNETSFQTSVKSLGPIDIISIYKLCNLSFVRSNLTTQEKGLLDNMERQVEAARRKLTQNDLNIIDYSVEKMISKCETKKAYSTIEIADLDVALRDIWKQMSEALAQNNVEKAVSYYVEQNQDSWRKQLKAFTKDVREKIARDNLEAQLQMDYAKGNRAVYQLIITRDGQRYSFQLTFEKNFRGEWKIYSY